MPDENIKNTVDNAVKVITQDLPKAVKENKGAVIGAAVGYFLGDTVKKNDGIVSTVLGALVGHIADQKGKK